MSGKHSRLKAHELTSESQHFLPANMAIVILGKQRIGNTLSQPKYLR